MMLRRSSTSLCFLLIATSALAQTPPAAMPAMPLMPSVPAAAPAVAPAPAPAVAPAAALPEVTVPTVATPTAEPAPAVALPAVDASAPPAVAPTVAAESATTAPAIAAVANANASDFSYGDSGVSLLFTGRQMERMKNVLSVYETARRNRTNVPIEVVEENFAPVANAEMIAEPVLYPVYTLKSIAFHNARDWTVWIGSLRITPNKNDQEVKVLAVSPNRAQFLWKPVYAEAMHQRDGMKMFAPTAPLKHKLTRPNTAIYDRAAGQVTFTLLQNQSFAPAYMATFEGKVTSPTLDKLPVEGQGNADIEAPAAAGAKPDTSAANPDNLDALLRQQQKGGTPTMFQRNMTAPQPPTN